MNLTGKIDKLKLMKQIYLDNAATTPVDPQVLEAMLSYFGDKYGNPGSIYGLGREAKKAISDARKMVSDILACHENEIVFTAGGTESVNLALIGFAHKNQLAGKNKGHIITTKIEHHAVLNTCAQLQKEGFTVTYLDVDRDGLVTPQQVEKAIKKETILVSIMYANNEIGTIEPIATVGKLLKKINAARKHQPIIFHTDACQAAGYLNIHVNDLGVDILTLNGSKLYGPKGIGALYIRAGIEIEPIIFGGGQEKRLRSGTENVPGIVGLAKALKMASDMREKEVKRLTDLRDYFIARLEKDIPNSFINGHKTKRLPNNINVSILGIEGESALLYLDAKGISCSTGSACSASDLEPSHVILALGHPYEYAHGALRFTLGRHTTKQDIDFVMSVLPDIVKRLHSMSALPTDCHSERSEESGSKYVK